MDGQPIQRYQLEAVEKSVLSAIENSELIAAERLVIEAAKKYGSFQLNRIVSIPIEQTRIIGWEELCADMLEADERLQKKYGQKCSVVKISLTNQTTKDLLIEAQFYLAAKVGHLDRIQPDAAAGSVTPNWKRDRAVQVDGVEFLMAAQRQSLPTDPNSKLVVQSDRSLAGLMLLVRYHQLIDHYLEEFGLPHSVCVVVDVHRSSGPEAIYAGDLGPEAYRFVAQIQNFAITPKAELIYAQRLSDAKTTYEVETANTIAQMRELYRLIRCFPFYRIVARNRLAAIFESFATAMRAGQNLPGGPTSWRMGKRKFELLLRQYVEAKSVQSVEYVLDERHVNKLHQEWLDLARKKEFDFRGDEESSLFQLSVRHALTYGGPILAYRWEALKPYSIK